MPKNVQTTTQLHSFHMLTRLCSKSFKLCFTVNQEFPDVHAGFRKGKGARNQIANICCIIKKQGNSRKTSTSASLTMQKPLTVWITMNWKILKEMGIPDHLTCLLRNLMQVRKQQLELDMEQQTGSRLEKEYIKAIYCHPAYLTYMQSTSSRMPGWMKNKLESRFLGKIPITSDMQMTPPLWQKVKN